jgi:hypothetical protein
MKRNRLYLPILFVICLFTACISDDDGAKAPPAPSVQRGNTEVNRFEITFTPRSGGGPSQIFEYYDVDGLNGNAPVVNESWTLDYSGSGGIKPYSASIKFFLDTTDVTDQIENSGSNYIVCYREMNTNNLRLNDSNFDSNGLKLGTETTWQVLNDQASGSSGNGIVKITLNYIDLGKEGLCDAGVRIFEATINYQHQ